MALEELKRKSNIVIMLNNGKNRSMINHNYILSQQGNNWFKILYEDKGIRSETYKTFTYEVSPIDRTKGDSVLGIFTENYFWKIKDDDNGCDDLELHEAEKSSSIKCGSVRDGGKPVLSLFIKGKSSIKSYYAPEHFLCCRGFEDRKIFIACKDALLSTQ